MFQKYIFLLHLLILASCSDAHNNAYKAPEGGVQNNYITNAKVDPSTAYLGKWRLEKLDGAPFLAVPLLLKRQPNNFAVIRPVAASASIQFSSDGQFRGTAGCNRLFGRQEQVYPDFKLSPIGSTKMGCATSAESVFVGALSAMTKAFRQGKMLILSNNAGREMLFRRD